MRLCRGGLCDRSSKASWPTDGAPTAWSVLLGERSAGKGHVTGRDIVSEGDPQCNRYKKTSSIYLDGFRDLFSTQVSNIGDSRWGAARGGRHAGSALGCCRGLARKGELLCTIARRKKMQPAENPTKHVWERGNIGERGKNSGAMARPGYMSTQ